MENRLELSEDLLKLIEKREQADRRGGPDPDKLPPAGDEAARPCEERRSGADRRAAD